RVVLRLIAPGPGRVTIGVGQIFESGGTSVVYMGETGTARSITVDTNGGTPNVAEVALRHAGTGARENGFSLKAIVNGQEQGSKLATAVDVNITPRLAILKDGRPIPQTAVVAPMIEGLRLVSDSVLFNHAPTTLGTDQFPPTNRNGMASIN